MTCEHGRFIEVHDDRDIVTAKCCACLHTWMITGAQHCGRAERPRGVVLQGDLLRVEAVEMGCAS